MDPEAVPENDVPERDVYVDGPVYEVYVEGDLDLDDPRDNSERWSSISVIWSSTSSSEMAASTSASSIIELSSE